MKQNYFRMLLTAFLMLGIFTANALEYPKFPTQTPVDGGKYVLANLAVPTGYMSRTSWDGAYYFLGETDSKYADHAFTARRQEDGRWLFVTGETEVEAVLDDDGEVLEEAHTQYFYLGYPSGTDNLNGNLTSEAFFELLPGTAEGFYYIKAAEGQGNDNTVGLNLHLNAGGQYFVASEPTNGWYPDFYGGVKVDENGEPIFIVDDYYRQVMADSTSMNWAFVLADDLPNFVLQGNAYAFMNNYEQTYVGTEGYEDGFQATLDAALPLYREIATQDDFTALKALVQAKVDLYTQILKAQELDETALARAIAAAKTAFDTLTDTEALGEALAALTKACNDYSMGLGDITSMGKNMSFEDLSSQNGQTTTGVQPAPAGWNVYVNGDLVEGAPTQYFANWHGVNGDCTGYKDGDYGFGIWTPSIPEYEISQTITGLDNGTYTITAGLMFSYGRTTQRLFGNLNSTLMAGEYEYAEDILPSEYKAYANLTEGGDERTLQEISVRAYVYDGTLTFGVKTNNDYRAALRETSGNGDGWFKVDNFTITKDGFIASDQQDLYYYLEAMLDELANSPMDANYKEQFAVDYTDLDKGIAAISALLPVAEAQAEAYKPLAAALEQARENAAICEETGYSGLSAFYEAIDEIQDNYDEGAYKAEEIADAVAALEEAYQTCLRSGVSEGADVSDLIVNRSFENQNNQNNTNSDGVVAPPYGWEVRVNGVLCETADDLRAQGLNGWCAINSGDNINVEENGETYTHQYTDGTHLWGVWNASIPAIELSQTLTGLEPGTYTLTADVMARNTDWSGTNLTTQRIFANDAICLYAADYEYDPEALQGTTSDDIYQAYNKTIGEGLFLDADEGYDFINYAGWDARLNDVLLRTLELHFGVDESGVATIGFRTDNLDAWSGEPRTETAAGWFKVDNFTLYYESAKIPTAIASPNAANGPTANGVCYDLSGRRVVKTQKGVYILNGKKIVK